MNRRIRTTKHQNRFARASWLYAQHLYRLGRWALAQRGPLDYGRLV
jgi:hypothetical protein